MAVLGTVVATAPAVAVPGSPGVTQPGTPIFTEDFSGTSASAAPIRIGSYVGGPAAAGETYTAAAAWSPGASACNGWVMGKTTPVPSGVVPTSDDACGPNNGWGILGDMAVAMGRYQGMTAAGAAANQILSEYTNSSSGAQAAGVQLQSTKNSIPTIAGHFYAISGIFAETNCFSNHARQEFALVLNGVPTVVGSNLDPCTDASSQVFSVNGANFSVAKLQSSALRVPLNGATPTLGLRVRNLTATGTGNDVGFDLPQIVDVTPQLDKSFSPTVINQGGTSTLTFTVTNTSELNAKNGWHFVDTLPAGLTASGPLGGSCAVTASTVTSSTVDVTGNLAAGQAACTITVQVTSNTPGAYTNSGCTDNTGAAIPNCTNNVPTHDGLNPPGSAPLTVRPVIDLSITKTADLDSYTPGAPITYTVNVHNAGPSDAVDASFTDPTPAAVTNATWTCAVTAAGTPTLPPTAPTDCGAVAGTGDVDQTVRINVGGTLTYTVTGTVAAGTTGPVTNKATIVPAAETTIPVMPGGGPNPAPGSTTTVPTVDVSCPPAPGAGCSASVTTPGSSIGIVKTITSVSDSDNDGLTDTGDVIHYRIVTTNTGGATLTGVTVTDLLAPPAGPALTLSCVPAVPATLAPGATITCTADYVITAQDAQAGGVDNSATATGTPPDGPVVTDTDTATQPTQTPAPALTLLKTAAITDDANADGLAGVGDELTFTFHVQNTGNVTMTAVTVTDQLLAPAGPAVTVACPSTTLAPGAGMDCTSSPYVVTQADVDAGTVDNSATASGTPPTGPPVVTPPSTTTTPTPVPAPALSLLKSAAITGDANADGLAGVGDELTFTFTIENTGNVTLTGISVADQLVAPAGPAVTVSCPASTLAPGATLVCTSSVYVVTQADVDAGSIDNSATASGTPPAGPPVVTPPSATTTPTPTPVPALSLVKSAAITDDANSDGLADVGDSVTFTFHVENSGNVTLTGISVTDQLVAPAGPAVTVTCPSTTLAPGAEMDCMSSAYVVTQADVDAGSVDNSATASGTPPTGPPVVTPPSTTTTPTPTTPGLTLVKSAAISQDANSDGLAAAGDEITFTFTIHNSGLVTLHGVTVADQLVAPAGPAVTITCPSDDLAPGADLVCTSSVYVVTQADVDAGSVDNSATASGTPPTGPPVVTPPSTTTTPTPTTPGLTLVKSGAITDDVNSDGLAGVGDELTFTFHVENTGAVTMTGISVADQLVAPAGPAVTVTCPSTTLAPAVGMDCTSSVYVVTQADVDAGSVDNSATASGTPPTGPPVVTPPSTTTTPTPSNPGLTLVKSAAITHDADGDHLAGVGDEITFTFTMHNSGQVTLHDVTVADQLVAPAGPAVAVICPSTTIAPGATLVCTSSAYVVTQADVDTGSVDNSATASGTPPTGPAVVTPPSTTTTPTPEAAPGLTMVKSAAITHDANGDHLAGVGDEITFSFHVENTGNVTLTDVSIDDENLAALGLTVTCPASTLPPGAEMDCTSDVYVTTAADIDAGRVRNVATAVGTTPPGGGTTSPPSVVEVPTADDGGHDPSGSLAFTGSNLLPSVALGLLLVLVGLFMVVLARRRRESVEA